MSLVRVVALLAIACAGCSSDVYPISDISVEGVSQQAAAEYLYFSVREGTECAGVRVRSEGTRRILSFVRSTPEAEVDSAAVMSEESTWEGRLRVEVPIDEAVLESGGEMTLVLEGPGQSKELWTMVYPGSAPSRKVMTQDAPPQRR